MNIRKSIFTLALAIAGLISNQVNAQSADANKTYTRVVDASADAVWTVLRKMDEIQNYSQTIARLDWKGPKDVGGQRVCYSPDGKGFFKENIVDYNDTNRTYSYSVVEGVPIKGMVNTWNVLDLGYNKSMVVWTTKFEKFMDNPQMTKDQFFGFIDQTLDEMVGNVIAEAKMGAKM
ncbi:SRPBCC family protein [Flagellimonas allohymeniacidonis]|uniref:SRPBCC family protein n=1 Tax=Flagellimonas allohymeniacidonis TaxID=2517819 RepID=A0A4Q8QB31_9FLAO|nr:SRPBCC family protein [Allomuricauda hymeniacidonis]TAI46864.1 SRPBCC family protein [Allomuricauda hymeniacidonis]